MYLYSTRGRFTPENTDFSFPFPSVGFLCVHSRGGAHLSPRRLLSSPCALRPALRAFPLSFRVCCEYPCILGRLAPCAYCVCVPCHTCRAFSFVFLLFRLCAHCAPLRVPSHRARVLPSVQFICVPTAYVSAARPCALVRTVFHIASPLPLSRDANRWSRALAASNWVAQDTHTPPFHFHIHSCRGQMTI